MKKVIVTIVSLAAALLLCIPLAGCLNVNLGDLKTIVGNGDIQTREVALSKALTGIRNTGSFHVTIDPSLSGKAVLEGESNILDLLDASQDAQGVFTVSYGPHISITTTRGVKVRIPAVNGGLFEMSGSGEIVLAAGQVLEGSRFDLRVNGSGDIRLALQASDVAASINGSGDIAVSGETQNLKISILGSGNFAGFDLAAAAADVSINGSGDADVYASQSLTGSVNGSGDVTYTGDPAKVDVRDSGSGDVRKR